MRVLHIVNDAETGGAQTLIEQLLLARQPEDEAHLLVLLSPGGLSPRLEVAATSTTYAGMTRRSVVPAAAIREIRRLVRELGIDVVHSHLHQSDLLNAITPHGAVRVSTLHSSLNVASGSVAGVVWKLVARLSTRLDAVVACSRSAKNFAVDFGYRFPADRIRLIHNGTVTAAAPVPEPEGPPVVLHLARYAEAKDHPVLFQAFARVLQTHPEAQLVCAGHLVDDDNTELTDELHRLGIRDSVRLLGSVGDVRSLIRSAHAVVFSSNHEALPMAGIEALSEGVPVVTTDTGDAEVLAVERESVVPVRDPQALGDAVSRYLSLPRERRADVRRRSWELAREQFDVQRTSERYRELYRELLGAR
ncbi:glycosyltransferase [Kocuria sp.]|uniref:glycosyltransferase n=1 Tax=Kocuria sp. TaxID=1871328 RepID=UPI0026DD70F0|nr:glycosyltransferase [Kocuria sp.]MDO4919642.1 glycosyltransferase [Kocuria sp.]